MESGDATTGSSGGIEPRYQPVAIATGQGSNMGKRRDFVITSVRNASGQFVSSPGEAERMSNIVVRRESNLINKVHRSRLVSGRDGLEYVRAVQEQQESRKRTRPPPGQAPEGMASLGALMDDMLDEPNAAVTPELARHQTTELASSERIQPHRPETTQPPVTTNITHADAQPHLSAPSLLDEIFS